MKKYFVFLVLAISSQAFAATNYECKFSEGKKVGAVDFRIDGSNVIVTKSDSFGRAEDTPLVGNLNSDGISFEVISEMADDFILDYTVVASEDFQNQDSFAAILKVKEEIGRHDRTYVYTIHNGLCTKK